MNRNEKKSSIFSYIGLALVVGIFVVPQIIDAFKRGHPINAIVFIVVFLIYGAMPAWMTNATLWIIKQARLAREATRAGGDYRPDPKKFRKNIFFSFAFLWLLPPSLLLLPGGLGVIPGVPALVVSVVRMVRVCPFFEDLGISRKKYVRWHLLAYIGLFACFFVLKFLFFE